MSQLFFLVLDHVFVEENEVEDSRQCVLIGHFLESISYPWRKNVYKAIGKLEHLLTFPETFVGVYLGMEGEWFLLF